MTTNISQLPDRPWWSAGFLTAVETVNPAADGRLLRGRAYARHGAATAVTVSAGAITGEVSTDDDVSDRVTISVPVLGADVWERVVATLTDRADLVAALLDGDLPITIDEVAQQAGAHISVDAADLHFTCTCTDTIAPCKHAATLAYQAADLLAADPFALVRLRGGDRARLLPTPRARRSTIPVDDLASADLTLPTPPAQPSVPTLPTADGVDVDGLLALARDAARRAHAMVTGDATSALELSRDEDLARRAAVDAGDVPRLAAAAGLSVDELRRRALAWQHGGRDALAVLIASFDPDPEDLVVARELLGPAAVALGNSVTLRDVQLRLGRNGLWYPYRRTELGWTPSGDPADARELAGRLAPPLAPVPGERTRRRRP